MFIATNTPNDLARLGAKFGGGIFAEGNKAIVLLRSFELERVPPTIKMSPLWGEASHAVTSQTEDALDPSDLVWEFLTRPS
jgi:hypothetical protein